MRAVLESAELIPPYEFKTTAVTSLCDVKEISRDSITQVMFSVGLDNKCIGRNLRRR